MGRERTVSATSRTTVLVVDDDEDMRALVRLRLEMAGGIDVVAEAIDGPDALKVFRRLDAPPVPGVVVLDNRMPGMTGLDVARELLRQVPDQRIILFTAYADDDVITQADEIGVSHVVSKDRVADLVALLLDPQD